MDARRLGQPLRWRRPRRIRVGAGRDLGNPELDPEAVAAAWGVMAMAQRHSFAVATVRPDVIGARLAALGEAAGGPLAACVAAAYAGAPGIARAHVLTAARAWALSAVPWPLPNVRVVAREGGGETPGRRRGVYDVP